MIWSSSWCFLGIKKVNEGTSSCLTWLYPQTHVCVEQVYLAEVDWYKSWLCFYDATQGPMEGDPKAHGILGDKPGSACVQATTGKVKYEAGEATLLGYCRHANEGNYGVSCFDLFCWLLINKIQFVVGGFVGGVYGGTGALGICYYLV